MNIFCNITKVRLWVFSEKFTEPVSYVSSDVTLRDEAIIIELHKNGICDVVLYHDKLIKQIETVNSKNLLVEQEKNEASTSILSMPKDFSNEMIPCSSNEKPSEVAKPATLSESESEADSPSDGSEVKVNVSPEIVKIEQDLLVNSTATKLDEFNVKIEEALEIVTAELKHLQKIKYYILNKVKDCEKGCAVHCMRRWAKSVHSPRGPNVGQKKKKKQNEK